MKTLGHITVFVIIVVLTFLNDLLGAHVLLSIANLYSLSFILQFSFVQIFGLLGVINLVNYNYDSKELKKQKEGEAWYKSGFMKVFSTTFHTLILWGIAFLAFSILN